VLWWAPLVQKLKTRKQFQAVMDGGVAGKTAHFVLHCLRSQNAAFCAEAANAGAEIAFSVSRIGVVAPKRWARRAVTRNLIKRQAFAQSALSEAQVPCAAYVVRLRAEFDRSHFVSASSTALKQAVRNELQQLFGEFAKKHLASATKGMAP
jgi:ribonuclease P protein component